MRSARKKIKDRECYYHLCNRICGHPGDFPFDDDDKQHALGLLQRLAKYYLIEPLEAVMMGNHFHMIVYVPGSSLSPLDAIKHHNKHHERKIKDLPDQKKAIETGAKIAKKLVDISHFMQVFQQKFTIYFNKKYNRRGCLWAGRFFSTILQCSKALVDCIQYVVLNPVRALLSETPDDYPFSLWSMRQKKKNHKLLNNLSRHLAKALGWSKSGRSQNKGSVLLKIFQESIASVLRQNTVQNLKSSSQKTTATNGLSRNSNWTHGGIIGNYQYVKQFATRSPVQIEPIAEPLCAPLHSLVKTRSM